VLQPRPHSAELLSRANRSLDVVEDHHADREHSIRAPSLLESRATTFVDEDQHPASLEVRTGLTPAA
jgi:hypothetical protein